MDIKVKKREIKNLLISLGIEEDIRQYLTEAIYYCFNKKIDPLDLNLTKEIYPLLEIKFSKSRETIEKEIIRSLGRFWRGEHRLNVQKTFGYKNKPTFKKLIVLFMRNKDKISK